MNIAPLPGQRWINNAEPDLGLGLIMEVADRTVQVMFPGTGETRVYAMHNMPLVRVVFKVGDEIQCEEIGKIVIDSLEEQEGLMIYHGHNAGGSDFSVPETRLDGMLKISQPLDRLMSGQLDKNRWFELRSQTLELSNKLMHTATRGLSGSRTSLLPHQLYIAHEVGNRYQPRVLLADEVGLGKTIEAGMILHQQLLKGQAQRILIIVPETLQHQWLVEMLRRFNLHFSLFDVERFEDAIDIEPDTNPFSGSQLILCSLKFLMQDERYQQAALQGEWDMLIVDEAHHLQWNDAGGDTAYQMVEALAKLTPGVLLLTATPEQLGKESHFARLRLLDHERFSNYVQFLKEEEEYQPIADVIEHLLTDTALDDSQKRLIKDVINDESLQQTDTEEQRQNLIRHLLDQQGTGRILFRNTRTAIQGFPERLVYAYPLKDNNTYNSEDLQEVLIEKHAGELANNDPRIEWLLNFLEKHPDDKALLITSQASTVLELAKVLKKKIGIHAAVFHEGMSIIERDRASAHFADEEGSQLLLCSEIGGEGRNFQFAHHLVLFELPANPDLLEQRIGRIDRIGQGDEIFLHVPYIEGSAQEILYRWYYDGLGALQAPCPAAPKVYRTVKEELEFLFKDASGLSGFIEQTKKLTATINEELHDGRDKLLELNSFKQDVADRLIKQLVDEEDSHRLRDYMLNVFDCFGVDQEDHSTLTYILHVGDSMSEPFPCLPDEGTTITFDRNTALKYEDMQFITWEHEMVVSVMDSVLAKETGNTSLCTFSHTSIEEGGFMVECLFVLDVNPHVKSYMPGSFIRTVLSEDNKDYNKALSSEFLRNKREHVPREIAKKIVKAKEPVIKALTQRSQKYAEQQLTALSQRALENAEALLGTEIQRLKSLQQVNPNVRDEEIEFLEQKLMQSKKELEKPTLRLDALRILVTT